MDDNGRQWPALLIYLAKAFDFPIYAKFVGFLPGYYPIRVLLILRSLIYNYSDQESIASSMPSTPVPVLRLVLNIFIDGL